MNAVVPDPELIVLGRALEALRRERGLSQADAGARLNMTSQGWGLYESGRRAGLYRPDKQRRLTQALDASPEDLALAAARLRDADSSTATGVASGARAFVPLAQKESAPSRRGSSGQGSSGQGASRGKDGLESLQLSDDELAPWAASGVMLDYDPDRWPRRDQGCVIDRVDGVRLVRLYDRADAERIWVRGGPGGLNAETSLPRSHALRVCAVVSRRDPP